jgi:hypothetical protein
MEVIQQLSNVTQMVHARLVHLLSELVVATKIIVMLQAFVMITIHRQIVLLLVSIMHLGVLDRLVSSHVKDIVQYSSLLLQQHAYVLQLLQLHVLVFLGLVLTGTPIISHYRLIVY